MNDQNWQNKQIQELKNVSMIISSIDVEDLPIIDFFKSKILENDFKDELRDLQYKVKQLSKLNLEFFSKSKISRAVHILKIIEYNLRKFKNYNESESEILDSFNKIKENVGIATKVIDEIILYGFIEEQKASTNSRELQSIVDEARSINNELNTLLDTSRDSASKISVSKFGDLFKEESQEHKKSADKWLFAIFFLIVLIIGFGGWTLTFTPANESTEYIIHLTLTKVLIISALFYALAVSMRTYKAHRHNQILNRHRHNALTTFETFALAADNDQQIKNAILMEATHTIFSNQQTGYTNVDSDNDSPNKIIEIFKANSQNSN